ncbi:MAG: CDP-diacylglycerol--serine O-phosphatidyltransferase [Flavobacteriaceae bacterium]
MRNIPLRMLVPNIITLAALYAGLTAIRMSLEGRFEFAVGLILLAAVLDAVDGRAARLLKSSSRFGAELDSLADFVSFGVAPAILLFTWTLDSMGSIGWVAASLYAISMVLRLARFNVMLDDTDRPAWMGNFFLGIPAPAAALAVMLPIYLEFVGLPHMDEAAPVIMIYVLTIAALAVSRIPTFSGKRMGMRISREWVVPIFAACVLFIALAGSYLWHMLSLLSIAYLASIPFGFTYYRKLERRYRAAPAAKAAGEDDAG